MRIRRAILPVILALSVAGSALTGITAATAATNMHYHGTAARMHYHG